MIAVCNGKTQLLWYLFSSRRQPYRCFREGLLCNIFSRLDGSLADASVRVCYVIPGTINSTTFIVI